MSDIISRTIPLYPADILLPAAGVDEKWCVIAADQFTADPEYWQAAAEKIGDAKSTLHLILPEIFLQTESAQQLQNRVKQVQETMHEYFTGEVFTSFHNSVIYTERQISAVKQRKSLIAALDLESYTYCSGESAQKYDVRASEATVLERIPAREKVRSEALLELPHVQLLFDDPQNTVFASIAAAQLNTGKPLYHTELMLGGGSLKAWKISGNSELWSEISAKISAAVTSSHSFRFIVGDGNHSWRQRNRIGSS
ncbi:DUF1015 family protein [Arcanobacterium hippocoleae]